MTVLQRISTLITANINHLLDQAEDPEVLVKQLIREMEESIVDVRRETVRAVARHKHLEKQIGGAGEQMDELESKARLVLARGDEARARTLLARKLRLAEQREALERERVSASELAAGLKGDLSRLEDQVQVARRKRDELVRRKRGAQAQLRMQEASRRSADTLRSVAGAMKVTLLGKQAPASVTGATAEAYNLNLQGKYFATRRSREDLEKAVSYHEQALRLDPGYSRAWVSLAAAHMAQADGGHVPIDEGYRKARGEVEKALELDPNLAEAHAGLGWIRMTYDWDWSGADAAYKRALELEPGNAVVIRVAARLSSTLGRFDEAIRLQRRAVELNPVSASSQANLALDLWRAGRLAEADAAYRRVLELNPGYPQAHVAIGRIHLRSNPEAALRIVS